MPTKWFERWERTLFGVSVALNLVLILHLVLPHMDRFFAGAISDERPRLCQTCEREGRISEMQRANEMFDAAGSPVTGYWCPVCHSVRWENAAGEMVNDPRPEGLREAPVRRLEPHELPHWQGD